MTVLFVEKHFSVTCYLFSITHTEKESRVKSNDFGKKIMVQPLIPGFGSVIQERAVCTPADKFAATENFTDRRILPANTVFPQKTACR